VSSYEVKGEEVDVGSKTSLLETTNRFRPVLERIFFMRPCQVVLERPSFNSLRFVIHEPFRMGCYMIH
jgi:hypothetical protein